MWNSVDLWWCFGRVLDMGREWLKGKRSVGFGDEHGMPLPVGTLKRGSRLIDAAVLFIYGDTDTGIRVTELADLSRAVGIGPQSIKNAMVEDEWEVFRLGLVAGRLKERRGDGRLAVVGGQLDADELEAVRRERERLVGEIPCLEGQAVRIVTLLADARPGDKEHSALLSSLEKVERMLARRTGKDLWDSERMEVGKGLVKIAVERACKTEEPEDGVKVMGQQMVVDL